MVSRTSKLILINAVRHSESHNRRYEEGDMWDQRRREIEETSQRKRSRIRHQRDDLLHSFNPGFLDPNNTSTIPNSKNGRKSEKEPKTTNKYAKELMEYEESLGTERWGHGGYKELYPEEFKVSNHNDSHSDSSSTTRSDSSTRRRKKSKHKKKKHKKLHKHSEKRADLTPPTNITEPPLYHLSDSDCDDVQLVGRPKGLDKPHRKSKKRKHAPDTEDDKSKKPKKHKKHKKHKHKNLD